MNNIKSIISVIALITLFGCASENERQDNNNLNNELHSPSFDLKLYNDFRSDTQGLSLAATFSYFEDVVIPAAHSDANTNSRNMIIFQMLENYLISDYSQEQQMILAEHLASMDHAISNTAHFKQLIASLSNTEKSGKISALERQFFEKNQKTIESLDFKNQEERKQQEDALASLQN